MIYILVRECKRCGKLIPYGSAYCDVCAPIVKAKREESKKATMKDINRRYNKRRDPKYVRFYNSKAWKMLSLKRLQDDGYRCVKCGAIASEVDHIIPIQTPEGWDKRLDYDNTQSLCLHCHNEKHKRFVKRKRFKQHPF